MKSSIAPAAELSVVVPSVNGWSDLRVCLDALMREAKGVRLEVLVPERCGDAVRAAVRRDYPDVVTIPVDSATTIPQMRAVAFRAASGSVIAVIEDHVVVPAGWARRFLDEIDRGASVVGGSVENAATETLLDRAAFLCEYSHCLPPLPDGPSTWLTGNNVAYRRDLIERYLDVVDAGRWENYLHDRLRDDGIQLICRPEIRVGHKKHYSFGEYLSQRYLYARSYAGMRIAGAPRSTRAFYGLASAALPLLLFVRTARRTLAKTRDAGLVLQCSPLIAAFVLAWGWGEFVGYWFGPGDSLRRVC
jgi:glycosyl transferase family 2